MIVIRSGSNTAGRLSIGIMFLSEFNRGNEKNFAGGALEIFINHLGFAHIALGKPQLFV